MRPIIAISFILLNASAAMAQQHPQQPAYQPQQMVDAYGRTVPSYPQPAAEMYYVQPPTSQPVAPTHTPPQPATYGSSGMTDIRQMNF